MAKYKCVNVNYCFGCYMEIKKIEKELDLFRIVNIKYCYEILDVV